MQNTMRAHSAGQISMEGGVDVNKGHMVYTVQNVETTTALFRANTSYMVVPASLLVIITSYYTHHAKLQTSPTFSI